MNTTFCKAIETTFILQYKDENREKRGKTWKNDFNTKDFHEKGNVFRFRLTNAEVGLHTYRVARGQTATAGQSGSRR